MLLTIDDFADYEFPEEEFIVDPIWPTNGIMLFHGQQTSGKSQLALGILEAIVRGDVFLKQFKTTQGPVGYIQYDMPNRAFQARIRKIRDRCAGLPFYFVLDHGYHNVGRWGKHPSGKWKEGTPQDLVALAAIKPAAICIDSVRRCHNMDENDSRAVNMVYGTFGEIFPDSSQLMIHHDNKDSAGLFQAQAASKPRGSSAWLDNANAGIGVRRVGRGKGGIHKAKLIFTKVSNAEEPPPCDVQMIKETLLLEPGELTAEQRAELYVIENKGLTRKELVEFLMTQTEAENGKKAVTVAKTRAYEIAKRILPDD